MREFFLKLAAARGEIPADLLIKNVQLVNVLSGEIYTENVAIYGERFVGFGEYDAKETIDATGLYMVPGFIDGHIHFESSMLSLPEFTRAVLPHGTTAVVIDPHEIANVLGLDGIRYVLNEARSLPLSVFVMLPSCVPATPLETSGAVITDKELNVMIYEENVVGIGEMMNFPAVINGDDQTHWKINAARWKKVDGHAPGVSGKDLNAYILSNISSDHESTSAEEALEKVRKGLHVLVREGTSERNLEEIVSIINSHNVANFSFATDDKYPQDLVQEGHIDHAVRKAIALGLDVISAYQMATVNTARHFNLKNSGAIKPRYWADFLLISDLNQVTIEAVYKKGTPMVENGQLMWKTNSKPSHIRSTMDPGDVKVEDFKIPVKGDNIRVIEIVPNQIITNETICPVHRVGDFAEADISRDILKVVVIERHAATGHMARGFVKGLGLQNGAIGSTVAHDAHNIVIVGTNDDDMYMAFDHLRRLKGGLVAVENGEIIADLPLPIAGLISNQPLETVVEKLNFLNERTKKLGSFHNSPFMILSFLSLSPIPALKITDQGLIDVNHFQFVDLFVD